MRIEAGEISSQAHNFITPTLMGTNWRPTKSMLICSEVGGTQNDALSPIL
jgi:hypothetical protein